MQVGSNQKLCIKVRGSEPPYRAYAPALSFSRAREETICGGCLQAATVDNTRAESNVIIRLTGTQSFSTQNGLLVFDYVTITGNRGSSTNTASVQFNGGVRVCDARVCCVTMYLHT